jgi:predicted PurR-regulated permease PerM
MSVNQAIVASPADVGGSEDKQKRQGDVAATRGPALPGAVWSASILVLTVLAVVYTLHLGKEIILPILLAIVLKLLLQPAMRLLHEGICLPQALSAILLIVTLFGAIAALAFTVSIPATGWLKKAPESLPLLQEKLTVLRQPLSFLQQSLKEVENVTAGTPQGGNTQTVRITQSSGLGSYVATGTAATLSRFFTTMIMLFFLLASGDRLLRGLIEVLPRFSDKRQAVEIATAIQQNITGYLVTITIMNALVGIATGLAMWGCGLGTPLLWGAVAFLLNYIPILGPMTGLVVFFVAGILSLSWPWLALLPAVIYLLIHIAEGETITPMLLAQRFTLNPVLVIVSLFFWHTIWGIPGALLAVPLLAMFKIVCDHVESLKPVGHIIGA